MSKSTPLKLTVIYTKNYSDNYPSDGTLKAVYSAEGHHKKRLLNGNKISLVSDHPIDPANSIRIIDYEVVSGSVIKIYVLETMEEIHDMWLR